MRIDDLGPFCMCSNYVGVHTHQQADGALPNGSRVVKIKTDPGDGHPLGSLATVVGSIGVPIGKEFADPYFYFVVWDARPRIAVGVASGKLGPR
jgi:hypothetical protein